MKNKQKLIFFTLDITIPGGIERVISNMVQYYSVQNKYDIEIISIFKKNKEIAYYIPEDIKVVYLSNISYDLTSFWRKIISHFHIIYLLWLSSIPEGAILLSTTTNITIYLSLLKYRYRNNKIIAAEHGYYYAFGRIVRSLRFLLYRFVDVVVTLTNSEKRVYDRFCRKVVVIPNSLSFFPSSVADFENKRIISVGRLVHEKGFEDLLPVYVKLAKKYNDWEFVIFGSGYLEEKLMEYLESAPLNVKLYPSSQNIEKELLSSSIYVCSSKTEAFPMVLLEAQACGLSIVSFDCPPGPREIINDSFDGILVPPKDFNSLSDTLEYLINNPLLRKKYSENARSSASRFLPENIYKLWDLILH